jgi:ABC-type dipeptide/oligopeptide/nickel transport system ATPase component
MAKRKCSKDGCHAPVDFCIESGGPLHDQCQYFEESGASKVSAKTAKKSAVATTIPWTGDWLRPGELDLLTHRGTPRVIGLVGSSGAGKTTYLAMLYSLLFNGKRIENWDFAGSYTLKGWELQAKTLQIQEDGTIRNPDATPSDKDFYSLYHLALRHDSFLHDILFADSSGEVFSKWADNVNDPAAENARWIYGNAHAFLFFVDCEAILNQRGRAKRDIVQMAEQVKRGLRGRPVVIVWSKADLAVQMRESIVEAIKQSLSEIFPKAVSLEISNYSKSDSDQLCHINNVAVTKKVLDQLANPKPLHITPAAIQTVDYFFLYPGSNDSK